MDKDVGSRLYDKFVKLLEETLLKECSEYKQQGNNSNTNTNPNNNNNTDDTNKANNNNPTGNYPAIFFIFPIVSSSTR